MCPGILNPKSAILFLKGVQFPDKLQTSSQQAVITIYIVTQYS